MFVERVVLSGLRVPWSANLFVEDVVVSGLSGPAGDVFAESVLMPGLTRNTWRVTKRVE